MFPTNALRTFWEIVSTTSHEAMTHTQQISTSHPATESVHHMKSTSSQASIADEATLARELHQLLDSGTKNIPDQSNEHIPDQLAEFLRLNPNFNIHTLRSNTSLETQPENPERKPFFKLLQIGRGITVQKTYEMVVNVITHMNRLSTRINYTEAMINHRDSTSSTTPFIEAARVRYPAVWRYPDLFKLLLNNGGDPFTFTMSVSATICFSGAIMPITPLNLFVEHRSLDDVLFLIDHVARYNITTSARELLNPCIPVSQVVSLALSYLSIRTTKELVNFPERNSDAFSKPLFNAIFFSNYYDRNEWIKIIETLLNHGADPRACVEYDLKRQSIRDHAAEVRVINIKRTPLILKAASSCLELQHVIEAAQKKVIQLLDNKCQALDEEEFELTKRQGANSNKGLLSRLQIG